MSGGIFAAGSSQLMMADRVWDPEGKEYLDMLSAYS